MRKSFTVGMGLTLAIVATPAFARHHPGPIAYPPGYFEPSYGDVAYPQAQASFPVDRALAERCGLHAGSVNPYPLPIYDHPGRRHREAWSGGPAYAPGPAMSGECANVLPVGYMLVSVPGTSECHDEVVTHEEWVPEDVTAPALRRAPPLRDKRTKLRRVK